MTLNALFTADTRTFVKAYREMDDHGKLLVWVELQRRCLEGDMTVFVKYLMPVLKPVITYYGSHLPDHGTYREDFEQEAMITVFEHLPDYNPNYRDGYMLGSKYFKETCLRTAYNRIRRQYQADHTSFSTDNLDDVLESNDRYMDDTLADDCIKREVIEHYEQTTVYSSNSYRYRKTREWADAKQISFYDIFS